MRTLTPPLLLVLLTLSFVPRAGGHAYPDLPVRASFGEDRSTSIAIEIDLRCFVDDPVNEPYVLNWVLEEMSEEERDEYRSLARDLLKESVEVRFGPGGSAVPEFDFIFTKTEGAPLEKLDDPVMITAHWHGVLPGNVTSYQLHAPPGCRFGVIFDNHLHGEKVERVQVLFPGESSYVLDLTGTPQNSSGGAAAPVDQGNFRGHAHLGFAQLLPSGIKSILFLVGVFLLSRKWRPLFWQIGAFTLAHSLTLWLGALDLVRVPLSTVDPLIAASIAVVAIGNVFRPRYTRWRTLVVFAFGLVHGLGFADAFTALEPGDGSLLVSVAGFNLGIELAQLTVIAIAYFATVWLHQSAPYRKYVVVPTSLVIAGAGIYWMIERFTTG